MTHRNQGIGLRIIWIVLGVALFVLGQSWRENAWAQEELFVTNTANNSVRVCAWTASGNTGPIRVLQGAATGLTGPRGLFVDTFNNELVVANDSNNSVTVYSRTATGNTAPLRTLQGAATNLQNSRSAFVDTVNDELVVANGIDSVTVYSRTASGNTAPLRTLSGPATGVSGPEGLAVTPAAVPTPSPSAAVGLNGSAFSTGQTITYQAILLPGAAPAQVDIYLGCLLPDGVTFLSLVQPAPGTINVVLGPSPVPFLTNVPLAPLGVPFPYTFRGFEPLGTYFPNAGIAVAGSNPFLPANQLSFAVQPFELG